MLCPTNGRSGGILKGSSFEENGLHISKFVYPLDIIVQKRLKKKGSQMTTSRYIWYSLPTGLLSSQSAMCRPSTGGGNIKNQELEKDDEHWHSSNKEKENSRSFIEELSTDWLQ